MTESDGGNRYRLSYGTLDLDEVLAKSADFPSTFGRWIPAEVQPSAESARIGQYVEYSVEAGRLFDATNGAGEWEAFVATREPTFQKLTDSEDWWLVRPDGSRVAILVPDFLPNEELVWRYDTTRV